MNAVSESTQPDRETSTPRLLGIGLGTRFLVDTAKQMFGPFLSIFAAGFGMDIVALGQLLSVRSVVGITAPVFGALADRIGYRRVLQAELLLSAAGMFLIGASRSLWALVLGMILTGVGTSAFVPTLQAYLSERLSYSRRARGLGIVEYAWALSNLVGLFAMGYVLKWADWRAPFYILGAALAASALLFRGGNDVQHRTTREASNGRSLAARVRDFVSFRANGASAWAAILVMGLLIFAGMNVSMVYGAWLQGEYRLDAAALGATAVAVGAADLCASVLVSLGVDRLGKRRSVLGGMGLLLLALALLPVLNRGLALALAGIALMRFSFEFSVVSLIPLLSEQSAADRGKVLSLSTVLGLAGGTVASITGPWAYTRHGVGGLAVLSIAATLAAIALAWRVRETG